MKRKQIFETFSKEWPPRQPGAFDEQANFVGADDVSRIVNKSDLERSWQEFIGWINFSELVRALERKATSIDQTSLRIISQSIFSIEIGLSKIIRRWSTLRKLSYPKDSSFYNAYSFVQTCMALKRALPAKESEQLKRRVISGLLPSGRLADLDLELQIWRSLSRAPESIVHFGVLGEPGPDFLVSSGGFDIEIEGKCISPETGMPLSYGLVSSLMQQVSGNLRGRYPGQFVTIEAEVKDTHPTSRAARVFRTQIEQTYNRGLEVVSPELITKISFRSLDEIIAEFGPIGDNSSAVFGKYRRQYGDFGLFTGDQNECVFLNLVPLAPSKTLKKMMRIISDAGEQFSKTRPAILWLHLLALPASQSQSDDEGMLDMFDRLLDHAFGPRRSHISIVVFSSDMHLTNRKAMGASKEFRAADGKNHRRFYANPNAKFSLTQSGNSPSTLLPEINSG
jgi:hypothetical protein